MAAGLESIVLGETEILGQLRSAARGASPEIERVLARAVAVGRAFRRRNSLAADAGHLFDLGLSSAAIPHPATVLIVGSGPTARRLASRANSTGAVVTVASRVRPQWATAGHLSWTSLAAVHEVGAEAAFICLGGDAPVLPATALRTDVVIDVSTPRRTEYNDPRVVTLAAIREQTLHAERGRREALQSGLDSDVRKAIDAWQSDSTTPLGRLRESVELLRQDELRRLRRRHPEIPEATIDAVTRSMVNRMFHHPVVRLKTLQPEIAASIADLFAAPASGGRE